jgi:hypothetical protein
MNNAYNMLIPTTTSESEHFYLNTFLFTDPTGYDEITCETTICIKDEKGAMNQQPWWNIKLTSIYSNGKQVKTSIDALESLSHPMTSIKGNMHISNFNGFEVIKNDMTKIMIDYLMMEDSELAHETDTMTPQDYRRNILHCLSQFTL